MAQRKVDDLRPANFIQTEEGPVLVDALISEGSMHTFESSLEFERLDDTAAFQDDDPFTDQLFSANRPPNRH